MSTKPTVGQSVRVNSELTEFPVGTIIIDPGGMSARIGYQLGIGKTVVCQDVNGNADSTYSLVPERYNSYQPLPLDIEHDEGEMVVIWVP